VLFPSISFLFYFLPAFFVIYCAVPGMAAKNVVLLVASLLFYAWGEPRFVALLAISIVLNYGVALAIDRTKGNERLMASAVPIDTEFEDGGDLVESGGDGPTVVVIGDSFTRGYWQDYFGLRASRYVWIHHEECGFKDGVIESYKPAIVVLAPVERQMFCWGGK
jgi:hypothetical protein